MDLTTTYLGLNLRTPLVPSASPLSDSIDHIKRMEDAGASAVVLYSLFEEQLRNNRKQLYHNLLQGTDSFAEALTFVPEPSEFKLGPEEYLQHIARAKEAVKIPIIASMNDSLFGGWAAYAQDIEQAGADALELNIYSVPTDPNLTAEDIEKACVDIVSSVKSQTRLPLSVKLSPYFTNLGNVAKRLEVAGADGLVLFNRFYQPDIDLETLEVVPNLRLSTSFAMRLPLRWMAILYGRISASLAATGGIHQGRDALKMLTAGADVTMLCSVLMARGISYISTIENDMREWMEEHEYESVSQLKGSMSQINCPDPSAFERAQYVRAISHANCTRYEL